jgi:ABC-type dipeptide/oligopeptide/nickel transport system permease subunit
VDWYPWVVLAHVVAVIVAFGAHGVSAFAMFRVKRETDRPRIAAVLDLSSTALIAAGIALIIALLLGLVAAIMGGHFSRLWPWVAIVIVVLVWLLMTPMAANPMTGIRAALGLPSRLDKKGDPPRQPASEAELAIAQARLQPELVAAIGVGAIVILVWLMEMKPF